MKVTIAISDYIKHLKYNWKVALNTRYHVSVFHTGQDVAEHIIHGLIPFIKWDH